MYKKGSYGEVSRNIPENSINKSMKLYTNKYIENSNINECIFLSTFKDIPFITQIKKITIESDTINLEQKYAGKTLKDFSEEISYVERIKLFEILMVQMARFLIWTKQINVAHMDIKPANICIDENRFLTFIDWGFVSPVHKFSPEYHGTTSYGDPSYFKKDKKCSYQYDMFGCAMTLYSFISKKFIEFPSDNEWEFNYENIYSHLKLDLYKPDFITYEKDEIFSIFERMLDPNESTRITPLNLYTNKLFRDYWEIYPLYNNSYLEEPIVINNLGNNNINNRMMGILLDWLIKVCNRISTEYLLGNTIKLMYRYLNNNKNAEIIQRYNLQLFGCACLAIQMFINNDDYYYNKLVNLADKVFTLEDLHNMILNILKTLEYKVYPYKQYTFESKIDKESYKQLLEELYINDYSPSDFCFISEDKKYGFFKKHFLTLTYNFFRKKLQK
jgi:serine/threonine protein kinase